MGVGLHVLTTMKLIKARRLSMDTNSGCIANSRTQLRSSPTRPGWIALALLAACVLAGSHLASAQAVYGSIFGTVTDTTGAAVPNATVTAADVAKGTSVSVQSDGNGDYRVEHLIPDTYNVTAEATGFAKVTTQNVVVFAD